VDPETRYARSGDVSIAYQVTGDGPFDVVHVPGFVSHVEFAWEVPGMAAFNRRFSSFCRLIRFDKRGTGMSDRVSGVPTLETRMDDVRAVMDAAGSERAALVGVSEGGPMSILFAATYPERARALALCGTFPRERWAPDYPFGIRDEEARREDEEIERSWGTPEDAAATAQGLAPSATAEEQQALATMIRQSASPGAALALNRMNHEIDVRNVLPVIRVPTLVLNREGEDPFIRQGSAYLAQHIPGARHIELPGPITGSQRATGSRMPRRSRSSCRRRGPRRRPPSRKRTASSRRSCSQTSSARRRKRSSSATRAGASCSRTTT